MSNLTNNLVPPVPLVHSTNGTNGTNEHRYILEKGSKKYHCPECGKKRFVRYIDTETDDYLPEQYGRCDRETKCGYHLNPYTDGYAKMIREQKQGQNTGKGRSYSPKFQKKQYAKPKPGFIPVEILKQTLQGYEENVFIQNLLSCVSFPFDPKDIEKVISLYHLGTVNNGYRIGAITFPFIDIGNKVRAIQVKQFNETNHTMGTDFLHSIIEKHFTNRNKSLPGWLEAYLKNDLKVSCLFGEHFLSKYPSNPVALVEAPKTAVYGTLYFGFPDNPDNYLWLAVYNISSLNLKRCQALKGRDVYLFPDLGAFELWSNKSKKIEKQLTGSRFIVSNLLERLAPETDKQKGLDLADYLIKQDWRRFRKQAKPTPVKTLFSEYYKKGEIGQIGQYKKEIPKMGKELWSIKELEIFFSSTQLPPGPIKLDQCTTLTNIPLFVETHLTTIKRYNGNDTFLPYLHRLQEYKQVLEAN